MRQIVTIALALFAVSACKSPQMTTDDDPAIAPSVGGEKTLPDEDSELYWYHRGTDATRAVWAAYRLSDADALLSDGQGEGPLPFWLSAQAFDLLLDSVGNFWRRDLAAQAVAAYYRDFTALYPDRASCASNEDTLWWAVACMRASRITNDKAYSLEARALYDRLWSTQVDNALGGGMWRRSDNRDGKSAAANFAAVVVALNLYTATKDVKYLLQGKKIYQWASTRLFNSATGAVYDRLSANETRDERECPRNCGIFIGASMRLYRATGVRTYLSNAVKAADHLVGALDDSGTLMSFGQRDEGAFSGIAVRYLAELARRPSCTRYREHLLSCARAAWTSRRLSDGLNGPNWSKAPLDAEKIEPQAAISAAMLYFATSRAYR